MCGADLRSCGTEVLRKRGEGLQLVKLLFWKHARASLDTCFSSITKCACCRLVRSYFAFNTLLNELAFLKHFRLVTLFER